MKKLNLVPGPSELYFTVPDHIKIAIKEDIPSISHRSEKFKTIYADCVAQLKDLLKIPEDFAVVFTSSATEVWERSLQNFKPDNPHFYINGAFSDKYYKCGLELCSNVSSSECGPEGWGSGQIDESINADFIAIPANETSIGFANTREFIADLRSKNSDAIICVDMVSALPFYQPDYDNWDMFYFSVQKGFGLPAGLGVWVIRRDLAIKDDHVSPHRKLSKMIELSDKNQTPETPNVLDIYLLGKVCEDMLRRGIDIIRSETSYKAAILQQAISESEILENFVSSKENRSKTSLVFNCNKGNNEEIISALDAKGFTVAKGYGKYSSEHIRIANFPTHSKESFELLSDSIKDLS